MAAGTIYWDGSSSTAWTTAANWTLGTASAHTTPEAGDEVIFDGRSIANDATTACAVGDTGGVDYDLLHIKKGHSGTIGAAGSPLHTSAQKIIIEGSGTYYIECSENATGADQSIPLVIINNPNCTVYLTSNENTGSWCCEFAEVIVIGGNVYIGNNGSSDTATAVQTLRVYPRYNTASNATIDIAIDCERTKATAYKMSLYMLNGTLSTDSALNICEFYDGTLNYGTDLGDNPETGLDITTFRMFNGTFNWRPDDSGDDAYIGSADIYGGIFDASSSTNSDRAKVLGDSGGDIRLFAGATMKLNNGMGNITIDGSTTFWNFGGTLKVDENAKVDITYDTP